MTSGTLFWHAEDDYSSLNVSLLYLYFLLRRCFYLKHLVPGVECLVQVHIDLCLWIAWSKRSQGIEFLYYFESVHFVKDYESVQVYITLSLFLNRCLFSVIMMTIQICPSVCCFAFHNKYFTSANKYDRLYFDLSHKMINDVVSLLVQLTKWRNKCIVLNYFLS